MMMQIIPLPAISTWEKLGPVLEISNILSNLVNVHALNVRYEYLLGGPVISLRPGLYKLTFASEIRCGGLSLGLLNDSQNKWLASVNLTDSGRCEAMFYFFFPTQVRTVLSACNHSVPTTIDAVITEAKLERESAQSKFLKYFLTLKIAELKSDWRSKYKPFIIMRRLGLQQKLGRFRSNLPGGRRYLVVDSADVGYACRSLRMATDASGQRWLVAANTGDDSLSFVEIYPAGRLGKTKKLQLPERSAPIYLDWLPANGNGIDEGRLILGLFNFDQSSQFQKYSSLVCLDHIDKLLAGEGKKELNEIATTIYSRRGHWGIRGGAVTHVNNQTVFAAVDRDTSTFHFFEGVEGVADFSRLMQTDVDLDGPLEPISIGELDGVYYITARNMSVLQTVAAVPGRRPHVCASIPLKGKSRSSVAIGRFRPLVGREVALAIWGGDPRQLNDGGIGEIAVLTPGADGQVEKVEYFPAGVHPTDIVAGDFDGDGLDELAVLNYGVGLGPTDRTHPGGVQLFKYIDGRFAEIARLAIPNPRIALAADIDGDGIPELLVSLFFEKRVVVVKFC